MKKALLICLAAFAAQASHAALNVFDAFATDPISTGRWNFGIGSNANSQFLWSNTAPAFAGDSAGSLSVHLNSSLPTARLQRPLGQTFSAGADFSVSVKFSFSVTSAPLNQGVQFAFGLINTGLTGGDRTGSPTNYGSDNFFHTVELNYFPNLSNYDPTTPGPTLTPVAVGAQKPGMDGFQNLAANFSTDSDLGANASGITELPQNTILQATLAFTAGNHTLALLMSRVNADGTLTALNTEVPAIRLDMPPGFSTYDSSLPFQVNALSIMAYNDGFTTSADPSLIADITFEDFGFASPVPEPSCALLLGSGVVAFLLRRKSGSADNRYV